MDVLFLHPNFPGQFRQLAHRLSEEPGFNVYSLGDESWMPDTFHAPKVERLSYNPPDPAGDATHPYVRSIEAAVRRGQAVIRALLPLKHQGFDPHVIYAHPGWGDALFLKDAFPNARIISLLEYFYHPRGADVGFDPDFPVSFDDLFRLRMLNTIQLHALENSDCLISPTSWQRSRYPQIHQTRIEVIHEGLDTELLKPLHAKVALAGGLTLSTGDEVLTYVSRSLEPYRGFHILMRALPAILQARPTCHVIIVGGDKECYGPACRNAASWREWFVQIAPDGLDLSRVHFVGQLAYPDYLNVLRISRAHIYFTYPFILSWSMLEALSTGALVIGSATAPVQEVIDHQNNGLLCPFFNAPQLATLAIEALAEPEKFAAIREQARQSVVQKYDFSKVIYPKHLSLLSRIG